MIDTAIKIDKLSELKDTFLKRGIDLIVLLAPGKASFFPEYLPDHYFLHVL